MYDLSEFEWATANLNDTNLVLILKSEKPDNMKDLIPISPYNILYKIFAQVFAKRLKMVLSNIISEYQLAFMLDQFTVDNVLAVFEVFFILWNTRQRVRISFWL